MPGIQSSSSSLVLHGFYGIRESRPVSSDPVMICQGNWRFNWLKISNNPEQFSQPSISSFEEFCFKESPAVPVFKFQTLKTCNSFYTQYPYISQTFFLHFGYCLLDLVFQTCNGFFYFIFFISCCSYFSQIQYRKLDLYQVGKSQLSDKWKSLFLFFFFLCFLSSSMVFKLNPSKSIKKKSSSFFLSPRKKRLQHGKDR